MRSAIGQWLELRLDRPVSAPYLDLTMAATTARVSQVRITTNGGSQVQDVAPGQAVRVPLSGADTSFIRVTVVAASDFFGRQVGITSLRIPGVTVARTIRVADDLPATRPVDVLSFSVPNDRRDGCVAVPHGWDCAPYLVRPGEDDAGIDRTFVLGVGAAYQWHLTARPQPGTSLDALIAAAAHPTLAVSASSSAVADPVASAQAAADGDPATTWIASTQESTPTLRLRWSGLRRVGSLRLIDTAGVAATVPNEVTVIVGPRRLLAQVSPDGTVSFAPVRTDHLTVELSSSTGLRQTYNPDVGGYVPLGIGVSEIRVPGVSTTDVNSAADSPRATRLRAGTDRSRVDGRQIETAVTTTLGRLRASRPGPGDRVRRPPVAPRFSTRASIGSRSRALRP